MSEGVLGAQHLVEGATRLLGVGPGSVVGLGQLEPHLLVVSPLQLPFRFGLAEARVGLPLGGSPDDGNRLDVSLLHRIRHFDGDRRRFGPLLQLPFAEDLGADAHVALGPSANIGHEWELAVLFVQLFGGSNDPGANVGITGGLFHVQLHGRNNIIIINYLLLLCNELLMTIDPTSPAMRPPGRGAARHGGRSSPRCAELLQIHPGRAEGGRPRWGTHCTASPPRGVLHRARTALAVSTR
ncbi:hypothetical protein D3C76_1093060 [compost metagenome]